MRIAKWHRELERIAISNSERLTNAESQVRGLMFSYLSSRGSLRKAARDLKFSAAYLSDVSRGTRKISKELLRRVLAL
jgi:hypothetical protein